MTSLVTAPIVPKIANLVLLAVESVGHHQRCKSDIHKPLYRH